MKMEKRDVYLCEFERMSFLDRFIFSVVNNWFDLIKPKLNPLRYCVIDIAYLLAFIVVVIFLPIISIFSAVRLKRSLERVLSRAIFDDEFSGADWYVQKRWVMKND